jgi:hypothetical protein
LAMRTSFGSQPVVPTTTTAAARQASNAAEPDRRRAGCAGRTSGAVGNGGINAASRSSVVRGHVPPMRARAGSGGTAT